MKSEKLYANLKELLQIELCNTKLVKGERLAALEEKLCMTFECELFANNSNLIITSRNDYEQIKFFMDGNQFSAKIELPEYEVYLYIIHYVNHYLLSEALD